ncbi:hypothetical protein [Pseudomonas sp. NPDC090201]|uniref:hypothetical protein n=1 Tax=Pseudomonas sp. NPDC090201 TaxID=3364475 RepID=UPI003825C804
MKIRILASAAALTCAAQAARSDDPVALPAPNPLIQTTSVRYADMADAGIEKHRSYQDCCTIFGSRGTPKEDRTYPLQKAYFVKVKVDSRAMTVYYLKDTCARHGIFDSSTACSPEELAQKIAQSLAQNQSGDLYGKYRAGFEAFNGDGQIRHTTKFGGYDLYDFKPENGVDDLVVGPMPGNPTRLELGPGFGSIPDHDFRR